MSKITRETETVWIYIKHNPNVEKLLEENGIHFKTVAIIELEEIDEPETEEELELFKKRDSGQLKVDTKILSFKSKIIKH